MKSNMKFFLAVAVIAGLAGSPAPVRAGEERQGPEGEISAESADALEVIADDATIHEGASPDSSVLRHLYRGEVVVPIAWVEGADGKRWIRVEIGPFTVGYVPARALEPAPDLKRRRWREREVVRDERPFGVGILFAGATLGGALEVRYLPLTRLGFHLMVGSVLKDWEMKGTSVGGGLTSLVALANLSPLVEIGFGQNSYHASRSALSISLFYVTAGLEWMFDFGLFIQAGVTYMRSIDIEIIYEMEDARAMEEMHLEDYGDLNSVVDENSFQALRPTATLGYAF
jgi:hypothetical protein